MVAQIYLPLLALWFCYLSISVIKLRRKFRIGIGEENNDTLQRAIRIHGNFAENIPFAVILLLVIEICGRSAIFLHIAYCALFIGRISHYYGLKFAESRKIFFPRVFGMSLTFTTIISSALYLFLIKIL